MVGRLMLGRLCGVVQTYRCKPADVGLPFGLLPTPPRLSTLRGADALARLSCWLGCVVGCDTTDWVATGGWKRVAIRARMKGSTNISLKVGRLLGSFASM